MKCCTILCILKRYNQTYLDHQTAVISCKAGAVKSWEFSCPPRIPSVAAYSSSTVIRARSPKTGSVGADCSAVAIVPPRAPGSFSTAITGRLSFCCSEEKGIKEDQEVRGENLSHHKGSRIISDSLAVVKIQQR